MDKIIIFSIPSPACAKDVMGYAVTETGETITQHISSCDEWSKIDMISPYKQEIYKQKFPNGFTIEHSAWAPNNWDGFGKNAPKFTLNIDLCDGKYTVQQDESGKFYALRNGQVWRDLTGDKLVLRMAQEIEELRNIVRELPST